MALMPTDPIGQAAQRDLEAVQRLWGSPVLMAIFDRCMELGSFVDAQPARQPDAE